MHEPDARVESSPPTFVVQPVQYRDFVKPGSEQDSIYMTPVATGKRSPHFLLLIMPPTRRSRHTHPGLVYPGDPHHRTDPTNPRS